MALLLLLTSHHLLLRRARVTSTTHGGLLTPHPSPLILIGGNFNHVSLSSVLTSFKQYVKCATRENKLLDLLYCQREGGIQLFFSPPTQRIRPQPDTPYSHLQATGETRTGQHKDCEGICLRTQRRPSRSVSMSQTGNCSRRTMGMTLRGSLIA